MILNTILKSYSFCRPSKRIHYDVEIMNWLFNRNLKFLTKWKRSSILYRYGCEIDPGVNLHKNTRFFHIVGIVIGGNVKVDSEVSLFQNITIGANVRADGSGSKSEMPHIKSNVTIYAGAVVVGNIVIGEGSIIGANAIVTRNIPPYSLVTGTNKIVPLD